MNNNEAKYIVRIAGQELSLPNVSLLLMLTAIVIPAAIYSINLRDPSPAQLLIAICIALFSSVVFLWILDATSILRFHSPWVSKSVYGAAIVSVLGTSVAVYQDAFAARKYPYEGGWQLTVLREKDEKFLADNTVSLVYSESAGFYWGYSNFARHGESEKASSLEVKEFSLQACNLIVRLWFLDGSEKVITTTCKVERQSRQVKATTKGEPSYMLTLARVR